MYINKLSSNAPEKQITWLHLNHPKPLPSVLQPEYQWSAESDTTELSSRRAD